MCIIITKSSGLPVPSNDLIKRCFRANPDGAGIAWRDVRGQIHISKGYMTLTAFIKAHRALAKREQLQKCDVVYHFRISTAGDTSPGMCHPFPLSAALADLVSTRITPRVAVAHNGHIHGTDADALAWTRTAKKQPAAPPALSDTASYIRDELTPIFSAWPTFYESPAMMDHVQARVKSKIAFLTPSGIYRTGIFYRDTDTGLYFSNTAYKPKPKRKPDIIGMRPYASYDYTDADTWPDPLDDTTRGTWYADGGQVIVDIYGDAVTDDADTVNAYLIEKRY